MSFTRTSHPDLDRSTAARRVALARPSRRPVEQPTLTLDALVAIAQGLAQAEDLWRPHVSHDPLSRTSVRLVATEAYEVWLLGWTDGQRVELHDHGGANAAFVVLEGVLEEITLGFAGTTTKRLTSGSVGTVPAGIIHDVVNTEPAAATRARLRDFRDAWDMVPPVMWIADTTLNAQTVPAPAAGHAGTFGSQGAAPPQGRAPNWGGFTR